MSAKYQHSPGRLSRNVLTFAKETVAADPLGLEQAGIESIFQHLACCSFGLVLKVMSSGTQHFFRRSAYSSVNHFLGMNNS